MYRMDHTDATCSMASEKYLLHELSGAELEEFEEHLFQCHECAMDIRAGSVFLERGKVELAGSSFAVRKRVPESQDAFGWFRWWRPAFAIPAMAVLLVVIGYQNFVTYPSLKGAVAGNREPALLPVAPLVSSAARGSSSAAITVRRGEPFLLPLDIPGQNNYSSYRIELHNSTGGVEWSLPASGDAAKNTLPIVAPGTEKAGRYEVVVIGLDARGEKTAEVARYPLELQFPQQ
jgi:hypothetical protein